MYKNNIKYMFFLSLFCVGTSIIASDQASAAQQGRVTKAKNNQESVLSRDALCIALSRVPCNHGERFVWGRIDPEKALEEECALKREQPFSYLLKRFTVAVRREEAVRQAVALKAAAREAAALKAAVKTVHFAIPEATKRSRTLVPAEQLPSVLRASEKPRYEKPVAAKQPVVAVQSGLGTLAEDTVVQRDLDVLFRAAAAYDFYK